MTVLILIWASLLIGEIGCRNSMLKIKKTCLNPILKNGVTSGPDILILFLFWSSSLDLSLTLHFRLYPCTYSFYDGLSGGLLGFNRLFFSLFPMFRVHLVWMANLWVFPSLNETWIYVWKRCSEFSLSHCDTLERKVENEYYNQKYICFICRVLLDLKEAR